MTIKMNEKFKRYLLLIPAIALLTGCGNDADSVQNTERVESNEDSVKYDEVYINHNEDDSKKEVDIICDKAETQEKEVYELFLNGELTVEQKEEQVTIDELFWGNDIEYCFLDIDGDGREELHIRDDVMYYVIKAGDGILQIFYDGRWVYEPVITDEVCGILHYNNKYNSETIEYITIGADGSTESDGEFHWNDENKNGIMDEEDYFGVYFSSREINMEQYEQYREEQIAKQTENELEWTDRRLKDFATWQEAYIDFVNKTIVWISEDYADYSLIYVDDDDIPELHINTGIMASGAFVVSFYDGKVRALNRDRGGIRYIEYGGLFYSDWGLMGFYPCNVYALEKGEFSEIGTGWIREDNDVENEYYGFDYFWEGSLMTEEEYEECLNTLIDTSQCIEPGEYTKDEILEILGDD